MSFLMNLHAGLGHILSRIKSGDKVGFEVRVNNWKNGNVGIPEYFGMCEVTPEFLLEFKVLCEKHQCGERPVSNEEIKDG